MKKRNQWRPPSAPKAKKDEIPIGAQILLTILGTIILSRILNG